MSNYLVDLIRVLIWSVLDMFSYPSPYLLSFIVLVFIIGIVYDYFAK